MPNYKFKCLACSHEFQKLLPLAHEKQKCLACGHHETEKRLEAPGVKFIGEGFYKTDSQKKPETKSGTKPEVKTNKPPETKD